MLSSVGLFGLMGCFPGLLGCFSTPQSPADCSMVLACAVFFFYCRDLFFVGGDAPVDFSLFYFCSFACFLLWDCLVSCALSGLGLFPDSPVSC